MLNGCRSVQNPSFLLADDAPRFTQFYGSVIEDFPNPDTYSKYGSSCII